MDLLYGKRGSKTANINLPPPFTRRLQPGESTLLDSMRLLSCGKMSGWKTRKNLAVTHFLVIIFSLFEIQRSRIRRKINIREDNFPMQNSWENDSKTTFHRYGPSLSQTYCATVITAMVLWKARKIAKLLWSDWRPQRLLESFRKQNAIFFQTQFLTVAENP